MIFGLLISYIGWRTYQTEISIGLGIGIQFLGVIIFEIMVSRFKSSVMTTLKSRFYSISVWLITPFFAFGLSQILLRFYPYSYSYWIAIVIQWVIYIVICSLITFILIKKKKDK